MTWWRFEGLVRRRTPARRRWWRFEGLVRRRAPARQRLFPFRERNARLERRFKWSILVLTVLAVGGIVGGSPTGRYTVRSLAAKAIVAAKQPLGLPPDRAEIDAVVRLKRQRDIELSRESLRKGFAEDTKPAMQGLMRFAGMAPENALLRWGNFNRILLLPSTVFEADDSGRSYRLRPHVRSVWLRLLTIKVGILGFFLVPDTPALRDAIKGTGGVIVSGSEQTTNSWGCRGPEFDTSAPLRGIVLGDSFMQGLFVGDGETPPACLERELERRLNTRVSILNTGHLGYSPEQYYFTLRAYVDRVQPHFVLVSVFANDAGDQFEVIQEGKGDWEENRYWLDEIQQLCRSRNILCVISPVPAESQVSGTGRRNAGYYQGAVSNITESSSWYFCDPLEEFVDEYLRLIDAMAKKKAPRPNANPLYNGHVGDGHLSIQGSEFWARMLGRRLALLLDQMRESGRLKF
jgi:hypothetical protein